ncbi:MAG: hypothetical protein JWQ03_3073 [Variovorax sp.]|nr:hypothetical protein [Variovorax sp.]
MTKHSATARTADIINSLAAVRIMIADMADAMPTMARDLRRNANETLQDIIEELKGA